MAKKTTKIVKITILSKCFEKSITVYYLAGVAIGRDYRKAEPVLLL